MKQNDERLLFYEEDAMTYFMVNAGQFPLIIIITGKNNMVGAGGGVEKSATSNMCKLKKLHQMATQPLFHSISIIVQDHQRVRLMKKKVMKLKFGLKLMVNGKLLLH